MRSNGGCDLHPQEHPIVDKDLRLGDLQSFDYGILDLVGIGHGFLGTVSFSISSSIGWPYNILSAPRAPVCVCSHLNLDVDPVSPCFLSHIIAHFFQRMFCENVRFDG